MPISKPTTLTGVLTFNREGFVKVTKSMPSLNADERAVELLVEIPAGYFERSAPRIEVALPEAAISAPEVIVVAPGHPLDPSSNG